jgi:hypothetical protein
MGVVPNSVRLPLLLYSSVVWLVQSHLPGTASRRGVPTESFAIAVNLAIIVAFVVVASILIYLIATSPSGTTTSAIHT